MGSIVPCAGCGPVPTGNRKRDTRVFYRFRVLLFLPGGPAAGTRAYLRFKGGVLEFTGPGVWVTLLADGVTLQRGGFNGRQWLLSWRTEQGPASALLQGEADMRAMLGMAPPALARQIKTALKTESGLARWRRRIWIALAIILVTAIALGWYRLRH